ncbi:abcB2 [Symbiodinium sp. CCMP2456]|nr:abcB2 [Symbiodinium sp. CCMP2456]
MAEAAAYYRYIDMGFEAGDWAELATEQRNALVPTDPAGFLSSRDDWQARAELWDPDDPPEPLAGRLAAMDDDLRALLLLMVRALPELFEELHLDVPALKKERGQVADSLFVDVAHGLLAPYPYEPAEMDVEMSWAGLLHGLVRVAEAVLGAEWAKDLCICLASSEDRLRQLELQAGAKVVFSVVCSDVHWSCLAILRGHAEGLFYCGKQNTVCKKQAAELLQAASLQHNYEYRLQSQAVSPQLDHWSCGHRVLLCLYFVLKAVSGDSGWPVHLPADAFSRSNLAWICEATSKTRSRGGEREEQQAPSGVGMKQEVHFGPIQDAVEHGGKGEEQLASSDLGIKQEAHFGPMRPAIQDAAEEEEGEDGDGGQGKARAAKRKRAKKTDHAALGLEIVKEAGLSFNTDFQAEHARLKLPLPQKHWQKFCEQISKNGILNCAACTLLRERVNLAIAQKPNRENAADDGADEDAPAIQDAGEAAVVPVAEDAIATDPGGVVKKRRGRPVSKEQGPRLHDSIQQHRPEVYRLKSGARYDCLACGCEVNFQRTSTSGWDFLLQHEKSAKHTKGLTRLSAHHDEQDEEPLLALPSSGCPGHLLGASGCMLQHLEASIRAWVSSGMLQIKGSELSKLVVQPMEDKILIRHMNCAGTSSATLCVACRQVPKRKPFMQDIARWSLRLDQASLAYHCVYRPEEVAKLLGEMQAKDYQAICKDDIQNCMTAYSNGGCASLLELCTRAFFCINNRIRTPQLQAFIAANLSGLSMPPDDESAAYSELCRFLDEGTRMEIMHMLGRTTATKDVLKAFHVNPKKAIGAIDLQAEYLPSFFVSHVDTAKQQESASLIAGMLGGKQTRSLVVSIDETVWKAGWEAVSAFRGAGISILGGGWAEGKDMAVLNPEDARPDTALAKMTLSVIVTRADSNSLACELDMTPVFQGKDQGKSDFILKITGQCMRSLSRACAGIPPLSVSFDNGTSNGLLNKALLGLLQPSELVGVPFFAACSKQKVTQIPMFPFGYLVWSAPGEEKAASYAVTGFRDLYHCIKNYTLQHMSFTRTVNHGQFWCEYLPMLQGGLSAQAFSARDAQSDKCAFARLNPAHLAASTWLGDGARCMIFLASIMTSAILTRQTPAVTFANACCAYYLICLHVSENMRRFGGRHKDFSLPSITVRNLAQMLAHTMLACLTHETGNAWDLSCRQERVCESHFSRIKRPYAGTPSIRDGVYGTVLEHLRVYKQSLKSKWPDPAPREGITMQQATELAARAMQDACFWQSFLSKSRSAQTLRHDLEHWFQTSGKRLLTGLGADSEDECEEAAEGLVEDWVEELIPDEEEDEQEAEAGQLLQACDAHVEIKEQITTLQSELAASAPADALDEDLVTPSVETVSIENLCVTDFFLQIRRLPSVQRELSEDNLIALLQQRMAEARPLLDEWCKRVRLQEKELSTAAVEQKDVRGDNEWNRVQHELCLARQASILTSGQRTSRLAAWADKQQNLQQQTPASGAEVVPGVAPVRFLGSTADHMQVVLFVRGDGQLCHGLVLTVWRGAVLKSPGRRMQTQRPAATVLPVAHCGRLRVLELVPATPSSWVATNLCPCYILDRLDVVAVFLPDEISHSDNRSVLKYFPEEAELPCLPVQGWNNRQFTPALVQKNATLYLRRLPSLYSSTSTPLLDDKECFRSGKKSLKWEEICSRAVMYFDTILVGKAGQVYSSHVFNMLAEMHPSRSGSLKSVAKFVRDVDSIAPAWLALSA